jgi:hypothetical protein
MVNVGFSWSSLLGIILAVAGAALYFLRSVRPSLARDHDIFFAAVGLLCGGILFFQGWRQDPILQFGQFLLTGSAIFFAVESIRLRDVATQQAKRNTRIIDDERPVSSVYRVEAELDQLEPEEELPPRRRIPGTQDSRLPRRSQAYDDEVRRRSSSRPRNDDPYYGDDVTPSRRKPRPTTNRPTSRPTEEWDASVDTEDRPTRPSTRTVTRKSTSESTTRPKRRRPPQSVPEEDMMPVEDDYVDYQPIDPLESEDDEKDNTSNFDY